MRSTPIRLYLRVLYSLLQALIGNLLLREERCQAQSFQRARIHRYIDIQIGNFLGSIAAFGAIVAVRQYSGRLCFAGLRYGLEIPAASSVPLLTHVSPHL